MCSYKVQKETLKYARNGIYTTPLHWFAHGHCSCGIADCKSPGEHPLLSDWHKQASVNPTIIQAWFRMWPKANISIVTGKSSFHVLTIDPRHGGNESLIMLQEQVGPLPSPQVITARGESHIYLFNRQEFIILNNVNLDDYSGIALKGDGDYVVAPPSVGISGGRYEWLI